MLSLAGENQWKVELLSPKENSLAKLTLATWVDRKAS